MEVYPSPTRPLIDKYISECLRGEFVLLVVDSNKKHADWSSRLITTRSSLLRNYANSNFRFNYGLNSPRTVLYTHSNPDVLDTVFVNDFIVPLHLTVLCSVRFTALS